jgi:hypothetical protein
MVSQGVRFGFGVAAGFFAFMIAIVLILSVLASNSWGLLLGLLLVVVGITAVAWSRKRLRR